MLFLLSDLQALQRSHDDPASPFDLSQLGRPRELLDVLKLAYHSSGSEGAEGSGSSSFGKLWRLMEELLGAESASPTAQLPGPFKARSSLL